MLRSEPSIIWSAGRPRIHAGSARQHFPASRDDVLQRALDIVISVRRLMIGAHGKSRVRHQNNRDGSIRRVPAERMGETQAVVDTFGPIGQIVQSQKRFHSSHHRFLSVRSIDSREGQSPSTLDSRLRDAAPQNRVGEAPPRLRTTERNSRACASRREPLLAVTRSA